MHIKLLAVLLILIGIAGLILPVIPGILLIVIGILLLYRDRHEEASALIHEKAPRPFIDFYNKFIHKLTVPDHYIGVDWHWIKNMVLRIENIDINAEDERTGNIVKALDECILRSRYLLKARYTSSEKKITRLDDSSIEIENSIKFSGSKMPMYIKGAEHIVLFVVTIGDGIEKEASALTNDKDPLKGYLFDRIGSFAVESLAENLEKKLRKAYSLLNKSVSSRFSPGYCDWPIEEQFELAKAVDFSKAGVSLTEGCMMVPTKSISGIVAVAGEGVFKEFVSSCDICDKNDCDYRRNI